MLEKELKVVGVNPAKTIPMLVNFGASVTFEGEVFVAYFDYPDKRLTAQNAIIRLRKMGKLSVMAYKKTLASSTFSTNEKIETRIGSVQSTEKILQMLGLEKGYTDTKIRTKFTTEYLKIYIDEVEGIPPYLEIEGEESKVEQLLNYLGYDLSNTTSLYTYQLKQQFNAK